MKGLAPLLMLLLTALPAQAGEAMRTIETLHAALLDAMQTGPEIGLAGRARMLTPAVIAAYDFPAITRHALGYGGAAVTPEQMERLSEAFARCTIARYARYFHAWDGERFETGDVAPAYGGGLLVASRMVSTSGEGLRLTYLLRKGDAGWRITDVLIEDTLSLLAVHRTEFQAALKRAGAAGVERKLEDCAAISAAGPP